MRNRNPNLITALVLFGAAAILLFALLIAALAAAPVFPEGLDLGRFLLRRFHGAAYYLPAYLAAAGGLLFIRKGFYRKLTFLILSLIPFITLAFLLQLAAEGPVPAAVESVRSLFGGGAVIVFGLLLGLELLLLFRFLFGRSRSGRPADDLPGPSREEPKSEPESGGPEPLRETEIPAIYRRRESFSEDDVVFTPPPGSEEGLEPQGSAEEESRQAGFRVPDIPGPPPLRSLQRAFGEERVGSLDDDAAELPAADREPPTKGEPEESGPAAFDGLNEGDGSDEGEKSEAVDGIEELEAAELHDELALLREPDLLKEPAEPSLAEPVPGQIEEEAAGEISDLRGAPHEEPGEESPGQECPGQECPGQELPGRDEESAAGNKPLAAGGEVESGIPQPAGGRRKAVSYDVPVDDILDEHGDEKYWLIDEPTRQAAEVLRETLEEFKISAEVTGISKGPVITMFEILPAPGVKLSKIVNLADNIALRLAASRVRIVAPIPGKHAVGIEVPNKKRAIVAFREMIEDEGMDNGKMAMPVILGKDITGGSRVIDLTQTPHLLIAGATGSGKSVCVNSIICSLLYKRKPEQVKMILIDPKIVELKLYNDIPHLLTPVITEPKRAFQALQYCVAEMERRYSLLDSMGVRDLASYNRRIKEQNLALEPLPYLLILVDEFADLMATSGKEMEAVIARLAAMSRAVGLHLVLATQRPSVDVITGLIKANIPSRIAFMVASKFDSRIIIDAVGAEKLLGKGDMLFTSAWDPNPSRIQGAFLSEEEVERIADHVKTLGEPDYIDEEIFFDDGDDDDFQLVSEGGGDPLMDTAVSIVVEAGKASASYLQRRLKVGYNRAARMVEEMEARGIVGPANGSKPREIIHIPDKPAP